MDVTSIVLLSAGAAAGALVQAATGFGFAIIAAPVFLAVMNSHAALQILVVIHLVQTVIMVPRIWGKVPKTLLSLLVAGALVGSPIGLSVFLALDVQLLKLSVGALILAVTALLIAREISAHRRRAGQPIEIVDLEDPRVTPRIPAFLTGIGSGALTALLVMPGPPVMLYFAGRQGPPEQTRALAITFFGLCYLTVTILNAVWAGMGPQVWGLAALLGPAVVVGTMAGMRLASRLTHGSFRIAVFVLLVLSGVGAVVSAL